jgi:hypothetical protein
LQPVTDDYDHLQRLEAARQFILGAFDIACKAHAVPRTDLAAIIKSAMDDVGPAEVATPAPLPLAPPELWSKRTDRAESPVGFVRRVYAPYIGHGFTRPDLRKLDPELYRAVTVWEHRHPEDRMTEIPKKSEVIDARLAALSSRITPDELRQLGYALQGRASRRKRQPSIS